MKDVADHDLLGMPIVKTQCGNCYKVIPLETCHKTKLYITDTHVEEDHYCDAECAEEWWANLQAREE